MKTIVNVWLQELDYNSNCFGLGDLLRGTIALYLFCEFYGYEYVVVTKHHQISNFLVKHDTKYDDITVDKVKIYNNSNYRNDILCSTDSEFYLFTNDVPQEVSENSKNFIKNIFTPNDFLISQIDTITKNISEWSAIHIRTGDHNVSGRSVSLEHRVDFSDMFLNVLTNELLVCKLSLPTFLLSDSSNYKNNIISKNKKYLHFLHEIAHLGIKTNLDSIKASLIEFFVMVKSKYVYTYTVYWWTSGFPYYAHKIWDVPLCDIKSFFYTMNGKLCIKPFDKIQTIVQKSQKKYYSWQENLNSKNDDN